MEGLGATFLAVLIFMGGAWAGYATGRQMASNEYRKCLALGTASELCAETYVIGKTNNQKGE